MSTVSKDYQNRVDSNSFVNLFDKAINSIIYTGEQEFDLNLKDALSYGITAIKSKLLELSNIAKTNFYKIRFSNLESYIKNIIQRSDCNHFLNSCERLHQTDDEIVTYLQAINSNRYKSNKEIVFNLK